MSDGEAAIGKLKPYLLALGIEIDISGAGGHVARVERKIQMMKERVRCHMTGRLPFTLTGLGISMLILFCVSRHNFQRSGSREGLCPREALTRWEKNRRKKCSFQCEKERKPNKTV
jgi:hypothetical protein